VDCPNKSIGTPNSSEPKSATQIDFFMAMTV
jgi:hypothetical protein